VGKSFLGAASVLIVTTHLHHGPSATEQNLGIVNDLRDSGYITEADSERALSLFRRANARRMAEVEKLEQWVARISRPGEPVLLTGSFNAQPHEAPIRALQDAGFRDVWEGLCAVGGEGVAQGHTWDPARNAAAFRSRTFDSFQQRFGQGVASVFKRADLLPRRIDYVFERPWSLASEDSVANVGAFGRAESAALFPKPDRSRAALPVSDHFGLVVRYIPSASH
jgi:hypothetical protein